MFIWCLFCVLSVCLSWLLFSCVIIDVSCLTVFVLIRFVLLFFFGFPVCFVACVVVSPFIVRLSLLLCVCAYSLFAVCVFVLLFLFVVFLCVKCLVVFVVCVFHFGIDIYKWWCVLVPIVGVCCWFRVVILCCLCV